MRNLKLAAIAILAAILLAACGSKSTATRSNGAPQTPSGGQAPPFNQQAFTKLRSCLTKHGVTLPNGGPQGQPGQAQPNGADGAKLRKAMQACTKYLPSQLPGSPAP